METRIVETPIEVILTSEVDQTLETRIGEPVQIVVTPIVEMVRTLVTPISVQTWEARIWVPIGVQSVAQNGQYVQSSAGLELFSHRHQAQPAAPHEPARAARRLRC